MMGLLPLLLLIMLHVGKIYMTAPTMAIADIILNDSAGIQKESTDHVPLYSEEEVYKTLEMVETVEYEKEIEVENFKIVFSLGEQSSEKTEQVSFSLLCSFKN